MMWIRRILNYLRMDSIIVLHAGLITVSSMVPQVLNATAYHKMRWKYFFGAFDEIFVGTPRKTHNVPNVVEGKQPNRERETFEHREGWPSFRFGQINYRHLFMARSRKLKLNSEFVSATYLTDLRWWPIFLKIARTTTWNLHLVGKRSSRFLAFCRKSSFFPSEIEVYQSLLFTKGTMILPDKKGGAHVINPVSHYLSTL